MAISLLQVARGAVNRQNEINAERRDEAEKQKLTSLAFAKEAYKLDLERYNRFMTAKDQLAMSGVDGFASTLANNYKYKSGSDAKTAFISKAKEQLNKDPEFMDKVMRAYGNIKRPNPKDYFENNEYDKMVERRIQHGDAISRLLFAGRKGPPMLTTAQMKAQEQELLEKTGGTDIAAGFAEEMAGLMPTIEAGEVEDLPPEKLSAEQAMVWYATRSKQPPKAVKDVWMKEQGPGVHRVKSTKVHKDGSQDDYINTIKVNDNGDIELLDRKPLGEKRPETPAAISTREQKSRTTRFLDGITDKNTMLEDLLDSAKSGDEQAMKTFGKLRDDITDRALSLRETNRDKEYGDLLEMAWKELEAGLTVREGLPEWAPEMLKGIIEEPVFEKPGKVPTISTQKEYDDLPSGTIYMEPDGKRYKKP